MPRDSEEEGQRAKEGLDRYDLLAATPPSQKLAENCAIGLVCAGFA